MAFEKLRKVEFCVDLSPSPERSISTPHRVSSPLPKPATSTGSSSDTRVGVSCSEQARCELQGDSRGSKGVDLRQVEPNAHQERRPSLEKETAKRAKHDNEVEDPVVEEADACSASALEPTRSRSRSLVFEKLVTALGTAVGSTELATKIEEALHKQLGDGKEYSVQARAILFNLKDDVDGSLRHKLLEGRCDPMQLPKMTADELLSDSKSSARADAQRKAAEATTVNQAEQCETDMFTCETCSGTRTKYSTTSELRSYGAEQKMISVSHVTCITCGHTWITR